jgi:hypothetical protein
MPPERATRAHRNTLAQQPLRGGYVARGGEALGQRHCAQNGGHAVHTGRFLVDVQRALQQRLGCLRLALQLCDVSGS